MIRFLELVKKIIKKSIIFHSAQLPRPLFESFPEKSGCVTFLRLWSHNFTEKNQIKLMIQFL